MIDEAKLADLKVLEEKVGNRKLGKRMKAKIEALVDSMDRETFEEMSRRKGIDIDALNKWLDTFAGPDPKHA